MSWHMWVGYMFVYFFGTLISLLIEGAYFGAGEVNLAQQLLGYNVAQLQGPGILTIAKVGSSLVTHAIPKIVMWDYAFWQGSYALGQFLMFLVFSAPLIIVFSLQFLPALWGVFGRFVSATVSMTAGMVTFR